MRRQGEASKQQVFCSASRFVGEMGTFVSLAALIKSLSCACLHNDRRSQSAKINGGSSRLRRLATNSLLCRDELEACSIIDGLSCPLRVFKASDSARSVSLLVLCRFMLGKHGTKTIKFLCKCNSESKLLRLIAKSQLTHFF